MEQADMQQAKQLLGRYYGYTDFRQGQQETVAAALAGRDVLAIMPTGAGKSICYQLPALVLPGIALVVSPLISLMKDQVGALVQMGVRAAYLNSSLSWPQYLRALQNARDGVYKIIYVAPERLLAPDFLDFASAANISLLAVDEAHCVSQWGHDFRPSYLQIPQFLQQLPHRPPVAAFTATATDTVRRDILEILDLQDPYTIITGFDRENLYFGVEQPRDRLGWVQHYAAQNADKCGIIYCSTRKNVEQVCAALVAAGVPATRYHAGLEPQECRQNQEDFLFDKCRVMVATNAFGMGIDKSNVGYVLHYNMPKDMESYYQEAGRAGRDGTPAQCILLYSPQDLRTNQFLIENSQEESELAEKDPQLAQELRLRAYQKLRQMERYCTGTNCLRQTILAYFGQQAPPSCGGCSVCLGDYRTEDITDLARQVLLCVQSVGGRFGAGVVSDILHGSQSSRVQQFSLEDNPHFGALAAYSLATIKERIGQLVSQGVLQVTPGQYPLLRFGPGARPVLEDGQQVLVKTRQKTREATRRAADSGDYDMQLFERLRALRQKLARQQSVPAYVVFTDATLRGLAAAKPHTEQEMLAVSGVGEAKVRRYGQAFLEEITTYTDEQQ